MNQMSYSAFRRRVILGLVCLMASAAGVLSVQAAEERRDVVFIVLDDLNDWVGVLGGHPQSETPNIDALAARGVLFSNAHCNAPTCNPSRKSFLSGLYPKSNGKYFNGGGGMKKGPPFFGDQPVSGPTSKSAPKSYTHMHQHFKNQGYRVVSGGKVAHGPIASLVGEEALDASANRKKAPFNHEGAGYASERRNVWGQFGPTNQTDSQTSDYKIAHWAIDQWNTVTDEPLMMTVGIFKPHTPLTVPKAYFDKFPLEFIQLPAMPDFDDMEDLSEYATWIARYTNFDYKFDPRSVHEEILHRGGEEEWKYMVQSYLACINYADTQVGHLLEALKENPRGRETMIILTGDHGWHLGEKGHWCKSALWIDATHIPYIVVAPGLAEPGTVNLQPISLVDTYPTMCDFAGIPQPEHLDGESLIPLLTDPNATRDAAFISYGPENTAMQTERYRYIRYEDGSEELYDHQNDPHEWTNQSNNPEFSELKAKLKAAVLEFQEVTPDSDTDEPGIKEMNKAMPEKKAQSPAESVTAAPPAPTGNYEMRQWAAGKAKAAQGAFIRTLVSSKGREQVELKAADGTVFTIRMQAMTAEDKAYLKSIQAH